MSVGVVSKLAKLAGPPCLYKVAQACRIMALLYGRTNVGGGMPLFDPYHNAATQSSTL